MELPALRLPALRLPRPSFGANARSVLLYTAYTSLLFLGFLIATFPHELILRRVLDAVGVGEGGAPLEFSAVKFAWWRGYQIDGLRVLPPPGGELSPLELTHLWVRPTLGELVRGNPYSFTLDADLYGGSANGRIEFHNGAVVGDIVWDGLSLGRYRPLLSLFEQGQVAGRVSGVLSFESPLRNTAATQAAADVNLEAAAITDGKIAGFTVGDVGFKQAKLKFKAGSGRVEVQELSVNGDVSIQQASGQIGLRQPISESSVNLRANILQTPTTPDWLKTLIAAIPRPPGAKLDAPVNITGTIAKPRVR